jgi:hypothetical protein
MQVLIETQAFNWVKKKTISQTLQWPAVVGWQPTFKDV